jgi:L,D-transpeptidase ErfK/SrfK
MIVAAGRRTRSLLAATALLGTLGCSVVGGPHFVFFGPSKVTRATARVPASGQLPGLIGELQQGSVGRGETLLDVARQADLGYQEVQDANPGLDEWVPTSGAHVVLPSQFILPRSRYRGVVINIPEMRLYLFPETTAPGQEIEIRTWPIGVGMDDTPSPIGAFTIRSKEENPTWVVPASIYKTMEKPRKVVPPGPDNPLGSHRMRLSHDSYGIHGTDTAWAVGRLTTHGCIRLYPEDIPVLYDLVRIGTPGELLYQPVKVGEEDGDVWLEVHRDVYGRVKNLERYALEEVRRAGVATRVDRELVLAAARAQSGIPVKVTKAATAAAR